MEIQIVDATCKWVDYGWDYSIRSPKLHIINVEGICKWGERMYLAPSVIGKICFEQHKYALYCQWLNNFIITVQ